MGSCVLPPEGALALWCGILGGGRGGGLVPFFWVSDARALLMLPNASALPQATAKIVDDEVQKLVREAYDRAKTVLTENMDSLNKIAERLIEKETMEGGV